MSLRSSITLARYSTSWPSTGPKYRKFRDSKRLLCFKTALLTAFSTFWAIAWALGPNLLIRPSNSQTSSFTLL